MKLGDSNLVRISIMTVAFLSFGVPANSQVNTQGNETASSDSKYDSDEFPVPISKYISL